MMKKVVLFVLCSLFMASAFAQDIIYMNGGKELTTQVTSITDKEVQFKLWSDLDGGVFVVPMRKVVKIQFATGLVMDYDAMREKEKQELREVGLRDKAVVSMVTPPSMDTTNLSEMQVMLNMQNMAYNLYKERQVERKYAYLETARIMRITGLIVGVLSGVTTFATKAVVATDATAICVAIGTGLLSGVAGYWLPCGVLASVCKSNAKMVHTASLYEHDFELGGLQMTSDLNIIHDNVVNTTAPGVGLKIKF